MFEVLVIALVLIFWAWVAVKVSRFVWRSTDPAVLAEMRTRSTVARMGREREALRRLEDE